MRRRRLQMVLIGNASVGGQFLCPMGVARDRRHEFVACERHTRAHAGVGPILMLLKVICGSLAMSRNSATLRHSFR